MEGIGCWVMGSCPVGPSNTRHRLLTFNQPSTHPSPVSGRARRSRSLSEQRPVDGAGVGILSARQFTGIVRIGVPVGLVDDRVVVKPSLHLAEIRPRIVLLDAPLGICGGFAVLP